MNILTKLKLYLHKPDFVIEITNGHAQVIRGAVLAKFIYACNSISESHDISDGRIMGFSKHSHTRLKFGGIPEYLHSVFRSTYPRSARKGDTAK